MPDNAEQWKNVNAAFSKQSTHFDEDDHSNLVLQRWRQRIYKHTEQFLKPNSKILELNAGTGIDAIHFALLGHAVHATDLSDGMISKIKEKTFALSLNKNISVQQVSFEHLNQVQGKFDLVFSNFGGLNCIDNLTKVTTHLPQLLTKNGIVTWVIMPKISPWEWAWIFKGQFRKAFRRLNRGGTIAHLEGESFITYYYSLKEIKKTFGSEFKLIKAEGLGIFSPAPAAGNFVKKFPVVTNFLNRIDQSVSSFYPFKNWGDHVIVSFRQKD